VPPSAGQVPAMAGTDRGTGRTTGGQDAGDGDRGDRAAGQGPPVPASDAETLVLLREVEGYSPALLDELTSAGEILGRRSARARRRGGGLAPPTARRCDARGRRGAATDPAHSAVLEALGGGRALSSHAQRPGRRIGGRPAPPTRRSPPRSWDLVWCRPAHHEQARARAGCCRRRGTAAGRPRPQACRAAIRAGGRYGFAAAMPDAQRRHGQRGRWRCCRRATTESTPSCERSARRWTLLERHADTRGAVGRRKRSRADRSGLPGCGDGGSRPGRRGSLARVWAGAIRVHRQR